MAKKKAAGSKVSAKAAKKAKAAQKIERKEKKKSSKSKDDEDDEEDLETILEKMRQEWEQAHSVTEELVEGPPTRRANATLTACPSGNYLWAIGGEFFSDDGKALSAKPEASQINCTPPPPVLQIAINANLIYKTSELQYNDVFRYTPEKDEWRKFVSPTCPGPRSAHAVAATAAGGGKLFLFGGEFSSLHQTTFHHYRDFWSFDLSSHSWDRIDTKVRPSARSGHRMAVWKHYIVLFGGFYDPGVTTRYLNDLWVFDTQEYKWRLIEFRETELRPSPRSGFSFLSTADGILLHGGYCKEYAKGKRPIGIMLEDTWFLKMSIDAPSSATATSSSKKSALDPLVVKWERRKRPSTAYAPALRSGCTMTAWPTKEMGILFGGVTDEDTGEETLESVFWNDLNGYVWSGKGRWVSMTLKKPKKKAGGGKKKAAAAAAAAVASRANDDSDGDDEDEPKTIVKATPRAPSTVTTNRPSGDNVDPDDPVHTTPLPRYNAMLAILRNTLYIYGGIFERGAREYTLDDFYSIQLDKMDRYVCLKESGITIAEGDDESSEGSDDSEDGDDSEDDDDEESVVGSVVSEGTTVAGSVISKDDVGVDWDDEGIIIEENEEEVEVEDVSDAKADLRMQASAFMGVAKDASRSPEDVLSTPLPGETLAMFYARSREYWSQKAFGTGASEHRGKELRRNGFTLAEERYAEYKPVLEEVEKILAEAGLDEEEMRRSAAAGPEAVGGQSRNRR